MEIFKKPELKKIMHYLEQTYRPPRNMFNFSYSGNKPEYTGRIWAYITSDHYRTNARIAHPRSAPPASRCIPQAPQHGSQSVAAPTHGESSAHYDPDFDIVDLLNSSDDNHDDDSDEDFLQTLVASIEDQGGLGHLNDPYPYLNGSSSPSYQGNSAAYNPNYGLLETNEAQFGQSYSGSSSYGTQPSYQPPYVTQQQHVGPAFIPNPTPVVNYPVNIQSIPAQHIPPPHVAKRPKMQETPPPRTNPYLNGYSNFAQMFFGGGNPSAGQVSTDFV